MRANYIQNLLILLISSSFLILFALNLFIWYSESNLEYSNQILNIAISQPKSLTLSRTRMIENPSNLKCAPKQFGVSEKEDDIYFTPQYTYPNCSEANPGFLRIENETIRFSCKENGYFVFGGTNSEELFGRYPMDFEWLRRRHLKKFLKTEWVFGRCAELRLGYLRNVFNEKAAERAKNITERIGKELGNTENPRPLSVLLVVTDSISRQSFFRNLNKTVAFLNEQVVEPQSRFGKHFLMYDFLINNANGERTPQNMGPIIYGKSLEKLEDILLGFSIFDENDWYAFEDYQKKNAIWKHYENNGFVTLFSYDSYTDYLSKVTGRKIFTDHVASNFWRAANEITGYIDFANEGQCIGNKNAHEFSLDYLSEYIRNYQGYNRFGYMHIDVAHEDTGLRAKIADTDLMNFLEKTLEFYRSHPEEDVVLMLAADHGRMSAVMSREALLEKVMPYHFVFANRGLIRRMNAHDNLVHNTERLVTRFDWHTTLKELALVPYRNLKIEELEVLSEATEEHKGLSLFSQQSGDDRDCISVGISAKFCSCQYINNTIHNPISDEYVKIIINMAIKSVNTFAEKQDKYCQSIGLGKIESAYVVYTYIKDPLASKNYYIVFSDRKNPNFKLKIQARFGLKKKFLLMPNTDDLHPFQTAKIMDQRDREKVIYIQIVSMIQESEYYNCPNLPENLKPMEDFCSCKVINENSILFYLILDDTENCSGVCSGLDRTCKDYDYISGHKKSIMRALIKMELVNSQVEEGEVLGVKDSTMIMPTGPYCEKKSNSVQIVCLCA